MFQTAAKPTFASRSKAHFRGSLDVSSDTAHVSGHVEHHAEHRRHEVLVVHVPLSRAPAVTVGSFCSHWPRPRRARDRKSTLSIKSVFDFYSHVTIKVQFLNHLMTDYTAPYTESSPSWLRSAFL